MGEIITKNPQRVTLYYMNIHSLRFITPVPKSCKILKNYRTKNVTNSAITCKRDIKIKTVKYHQKY